ncbi:MAG: PPC domain-containing protein, partial [Verrucomicrobia bacterium]|nr:PPC domain-containing protein [Verrucomicrobiota bacterium]
MPAEFQVCPSGKSTPSRRCSALFLVALCLGWALPGITRAELPLARLNSIFPPGGTVGTQIEVTVSGNDLEEAQELRFTDSGITAEPVLSSGKILEGKFLVTVGEATLPGIYDVRVAGRFGISNARAFEVGDLPAMVESGDHHEASSAMDIPLDTVISGRAEERQSDFFIFKVASARRLVIRCETAPIDSRMTAVVVVFDSKGREVARNGTDSLIDFTAPDAGEFTVQVHDQLFRGGEAYAYRLCVSTGPWIDFVVPAAGAPGSTALYQIHGRNLPGSIPSEYTVNGNPLETLEVEIRLPQESEPGRTGRFLREPASLPLVGVPYRHRFGGETARISNPVFIGLARDPVVIEQEPNDNPESANRVPVPCEVSGRLFPANDRDWVGFDATKGEVFWIEIQSHRLGRPTNPFVLVQRVKPGGEGGSSYVDVQELYQSDTNAGGREFDTRSRDPQWRFQVGEEGSYRVEVRDLFRHSGADARLEYRLVIRRENPGFDLVAMPVSPGPADRKDVPQWTPFIRKGGNLPVRVVAMRRDGFDGEILVNAEGLPPGVSCREAIVPPGETSATLMLSAEEGASGYAGPVRIVGRGRVGDVEQVREASGAGVIWTVGDYNAESVKSRSTREVVLGVSEVEAAPIEIRVEPATLRESWVGGVLEIPVTVIRRGDFNGEIKMLAGGDSRIAKLREFQVKAGETNAMTQLNLTDLKVPVGEFTFHFFGQTNGKYQRASADRVATLEAAVKTAEEAGDEEATKKAREALKGVQPSETSVTAYSPLIRLRVAQHPIRMVVPPGAVEMRSGGKQGVSVAVERLFGFSEPVKLELRFPDGVTGLKAGEVSLAGDQGA